ncbi:META domain-containing protein [Rubrivirga marina]|uniref:DUF306 domain-containing protein n=1 Tax=Rubrivirga marina TaxID=1196024 RepID=A0A271J2W2_9BACT|nr:META domain-containing protein [Rubrivirga marina]PAP77384.1 hypothetical protein BSZ37_13535 [Rubrivirga marina]
MRRLPVLLALAVLVGCDTFGPDDALPRPGAVSTEVAALRAVDRWVAVAAVSDGATVRFPDSLFTATFSNDGNVSGRTSANRYGGDYEAGDDGSLAIGSLATTLIGEYEERARLSIILLSELQQADRFEVADSTLIVRSADGDGVRFRAGAP